MQRRATPIPALICAALAACGSEPVAVETFNQYEEVSADTVLVAPGPEPGRFAPADLDLIERGRYLVELLGCGVCHTDGALAGGPDPERQLAGSRTGIAYASPLQVEFPGVTFAPNITPDDETGIGRWSDQQISNAITAGLGRHTRRRILSMPWPGYAKLSDDDATAIVAYLRSIPPIHHRVPADVEPGEKTAEPFIYFGVYRSR